MIYISKFFNCCNPNLRGSQPMQTDSSTKPVMPSAAQLTRACRPAAPNISNSRIPDCRCSLVLETETPQDELSFTNTAEQFDAGDGRGRTIKVLEAEHRTCSGFNPPVILLDQIVQVFRRSQLGVLPFLVFPSHLAHRSVRCSVAV